MIDRERAESEARRKHIAQESRAANPPRAWRTIPAADRGDDLATRLGFSVPDGDAPVNWAALTRQ